MKQERRIIKFSHISLLIFIICIIIILFLSSCSNENYETSSNENQTSALGELINPTNITDYIWTQGNNDSGYFLQFKDGIANFSITQNGKNATIEGFYTFYENVFRIFDNNSQTTYEFHYILKNNKLQVKAGNIVVSLSRQ